MVLCNQSVSICAANSNYTVRHTLLSDENKRRKRESQICQTYFGVNHRLVFYHNEQRRYTGLPDFKELDSRHSDGRDVLDSLRAEHSKPEVQAGCCRVASIYAEHSPSSPSTSESTRSHSLNSNYKPPCGRSQTR